MVSAPVGLGQYFQLKKKKVSLNILNLHKKFPPNTQKGLHAACARFCRVFLPAGAILNLSVSCVRTSLSVCMRVYLYRCCSSASRVDLFIFGKLSINVEYFFTLCHTSFSSKKATQMRTAL